MQTVITDRLTIRRPTPADLAAFLAYRNDPGSMKFQPIEPTTAEEATTFLAQQAALDLSVATGWIMFALERTGEGRLIGEVGVFVSEPAKSLGNIGWSIHPADQRRGYATEAARALLGYAFGHRQLHRVTAHCDPRNLASVRVMERLGMRREGLARQSVFKDGVWNDEYAYALLRDEWLESLGGQRP